MKLWIHIISLIFRVWILKINLHYLGRILGTIVLGFEFMEQKPLYILLLEINWCETWNKIYLHMAVQNYKMLTAILFRSENGCDLNSIPSSAWNWDRQFFRTIDNIKKCSFFFIRARTIIISAWYFT